MSQPRNGNRKCTTCKHYYAAHKMGPEPVRGHCVVPGCACKCPTQVKVTKRTTA